MAVADPQDEGCLAAAPAGEVRQEVEGGSWAAAGSLVWVSAAARRERPTFSLPQAADWLPQVASEVAELKPLGPAWG